MPTTQLALQLFNDFEQNFANFYRANNEHIIDCLQSLYLANPLTNQVYIWGNSQSGCSHLLQATCIECSNHKLSTIYLPLHQIINYDPTLLQNLEQYDLICIDDLHLLHNKPLWQEQIFHLFNRATENNSRLLFAASCNVRGLNLQLDDLTSRLSLSLVFQIAPLSDEGKISALQLHASKLGLQLTDEVGQFILRHYSRNMTEIVKLLTKLNRISLQEQRKLTIPLVKRIITHV